MIQLPRIHRVILDRVPGADHFGLLQSRNRCDHTRLHIDRHAGRHSVNVDLVCVEAFRLEEDLVRFLIGKFNELIFDGRAVSRSYAFNLSAVQRRPSDTLRDNAPGLGVVRARKQFTWGRSILSVRNENGIGSLSPDCGSNRAQLIVRASRRGGVPVFRRVQPSPRLRI